MCFNRQDTLISGQLWYSHMGPFGQGKALFPRTQWLVHRCLLYCSSSIEVCIFINSCKCICKCKYVSTIHICEKVDTNKVIAVFCKCNGIGNAFSICLEKITIYWIVFTGHFRKKKGVKCPFSTNIWSKLPYFNCDSVGQTTC